MARARTHYTVTIDRDGQLATQRGVALELPTGWTPEHLVLAALVRCSLLALEHHARRASATVTGSGSAAGAVAEREDGVWAMVEIECDLSVEIDPAPAPEVVRDLIARAERGCFVGSSLRDKPAYRWRVNGETIA